MEDVFLFEDTPGFLTLFAEGEFEVESLPGGRGKPRPSPYWPPPRYREDDIEEQLERAAHEAMLQQLAEARGVALAQRLEQKRIEDARALSMLSMQRQNRIDADPLHRPTPVQAATLQKQLRRERERGDILPQNMKDDILRMKREAALEEANRVRAEKKQREEEIQRTRLKNLEKARKARRKK
jgi:hypothetical protein